MATGGRRQSRTTAGRVVTSLVASILVLALAGVAVVVRPPWAQGKDVHPWADPSYYASAAAVCGLLSPTDLGLDLGYPYDQGAEPVLEDPSFALIPGITRCIYRTSARAVGAVSIGVVYAYADQIFAERKRFNTATGSVRDLTALGRQAVWSESNRELLVLTDDRIVGVILPVSVQEPERVQVERARRLAEVMVGRLR